ncbi:probable disease resistance protein At4g19530 [Camellia sinensis]|uniref:probable disease resistance protein At4g19530 n=1 Tax=Camellia sinensis TaxID=4442 RepID=UPI001035A2BD|nr:probable disease resistance protein At4g19530 [Camellia sinensis]
MYFFRTSQTNPKYLNLTGCAKLEEFPEHLGHMESLTELLADGTAIKQLPFSIGLLKNLRSLSLRGCNRQLTTKSLFSLISSWVLSRKNADFIRFLPSSVSSLCSLTKLHLSDRNLSEENFPANIRSLSSLRDLDLGGNNFRILPCGFSHLSKLENLGLNNCRSLQSILDLPSNLRSMDVCGCASLEKVSDLSKVKDVIIWFSNSKLHRLSNGNNDGMQDPHCFQGARIIPLDKPRLNNLQNPCQHLHDGPFMSGENFYTDSDFSRWFLHTVTGSSSISLEVPVMPGEDDYVSGFSVEVVFYRAGDEESCSMELDDYPYIIITDKINGIDFICTPTFFAIPKSSGDYVWQSRIGVEEYFGYRIKGGEQFEISIIMLPPFRVKQCAMDLIVRHIGGNTINFSGLSSLPEPSSYR